MPSFGRTKSVPRPQTRKEANSTASSPRSPRSPSANRRLATKFPDFVAHRGTTVHVGPSELTAFPPLGRLRTATV